MPVIVKQLAGVLNSDDPQENLPSSHHKMARNIVFRGTQGNYRAEICKGNRKIENDLPQYDNQCIGSFYDEVRQRVFYFNYNSYNFHGIYIYDIEDDSVTPLLVNYTDSDEDLFNFDPDYPIASCNILYRTDSDGDILLWTDRLNRPQCVNIKDALDDFYGAFWKASYLTVAKPMPLIPPVCEYKDDSTVNINNLRKKLYQFRFRWVYKNLEKSTWSPWSKLFAPLNPDDIATDINPQKNNAIDVQFNTGDTDVVKIEIAARQSLATAFSDPFLVKVLNKEDGGIYDNELYTYRFYNDSSYPYIDVTESNLLFDYVPLKANTQELLNGNVIIYGGITEGYDFDEVLNVVTTVVAEDYSTDGALTIEFLGESGGANPDCPSLNYVYGADFSVEGTPNEGDVYTIRFYDANSPVTGMLTPVVYTVQSGDDVTDVINGLVNAFNAIFQPSYGYTATASATGFFVMNTVMNCDSVNSYPIAFYDISYQFAGGSSNPVDGVSNSIYKHKSKYGFGLVYFDEFGVTNGVVNNDHMLIETPELTTIGDTVSAIPKISFQLWHQPPIWAKRFSFVRTANLTFTNLISTVTCDTLKDSGTVNYGYMNITNLQENTTSYPTYDFNEGDRVRIIGQYGGSSVISTLDFPIISLMEDPTINGAAQTGFWLKVPYDAVLSDFGTGNNYLIEIYTPAPNADDDQLVYYEFGETYDVLNPGESTRYHEGMVQTQTASLPATFEFTRGDFYIKERKIPFNADLTSVTDVWIVDQSVSDLFPSRVVGNGRTFVEDPFAKEVYYSTLVRYSLAYQQNTSINQTNRFYPNNFAEFDRARGDIQRFKLRGSMLRVFQSAGCGVVPVYQQILSTTDGNSQIVRSDEIINRIQYYQGNYGIGNQYCSLASSSGADYFVCPTIGAVIRLAADGITNLSEKYKGQFYISDLLAEYNNTWYRSDGSIAKVIGSYDFREEEYVFHLQSGDNGSTLSGSATYDNTMSVSFTGTPAVGDVVTIVATAAGDISETFTYTINSSSDTIPDLINALVDVINDQSSFFTAENVASAVLRIDASVDLISGSIEVDSPEIDNYTIAFNETRNAFSSFFDYFPEWMTNAQEQIVSWHNGDVWVHDVESADSMAQFYNMEYYPSITLVFNEQEMVRKKFLSLGYQSNKYWVSPTTGDIATSFYNPQTGLQQESNLKSADFDITENIRVAAFLYDANSRSTAAEGLNNGDYLTGQWISVKLTYQGNDFSWLHGVYINYSISNRIF